MTENDSTALSSGATVEPPTQRQIVEDLVANKKKSSNKQEIAEFMDAWSKLARKEGVTNEVMSLLIDGSSIAGAAPLLTMMGTDDACLEVLKSLKKLPVIQENNLGASLRIYVHLFSLAVNAGRKWDCVYSIISIVPKFAYNKEGNPFGTNSSTISKYLLRKLDAEKAESVLAGGDLQESTANKLIKIFKPAFEEAVGRKKPMRQEVAAVKVLESWLRSKSAGFNEVKTLVKPDDVAVAMIRRASKVEASADSTRQESDKRGNALNEPMGDVRDERSCVPTYDSIIDAVHDLERAHAKTESKLSTAEKSISAKEAAIERLETSLDDANGRISKLKESNSERQQQLDTAKQQIEELRSELEETKSTAEARAEIISMLDKNREQKGSEALTRLASKLKADYGDFKEYEGEAMTVELGEIVKLQLSQVFDTLKSVGVKL